MNTITINGEQYEQCSVSGFIPYTIEAVWYMGEWYKKVEPVFYTTNGLPIYEGTDFWYAEPTRVSTTDDYHIKFWKANVMESLKANYIYLQDKPKFLTREEAKKWVEQNIPKPQIKCEDGIVTDPDATIYSVCTRGNWETREFKSSVLDNRQRQVNGFKSPTWMHFTTEQKRKDWIMYNKPVLNYDDIMGLDHAGNGTVITILHEKLVNLLKQKV